VGGWVLMIQMVFLFAVHHHFFLYLSFIFLFVSVLGFYYVNPLYCQVKQTQADINE